MKGVLEEIEYTTVPGINNDHKLRLYALSTCAFCKKAMMYLEEKGYGFQYIYLDQVEYGHCLCGLYLSREFAESGREPASLPERREGGI
jgi:hypothetical protein